MELTSPLEWPTGWERADYARTSSFSRNLTAAAARDDLEDELRRLRATDVVLTTDRRPSCSGGWLAKQPATVEPGASVWFNLDGESCVLACERWDKLAHNLRAIAKHIAAIRGQERWGVGTVAQAFTAYKALPDPSRRRDWREVLGLVGVEIDVLRISSRFRARALERGQDADVTDLLEARDAGLAELENGRALR
jgi:hypothetical protein